MFIENEKVLEVLLPVLSCIIINLDCLLGISSKSVHETCWTVSMSNSSYRGAVTTFPKTKRFRSSSHQWRRTRNSRLLQSMSSSGLPRGNYSRTPQSPKTNNNEESCTGPSSQNGDEKGTCSQRTHVDWSESDTVPGNGKLKLSSWNFELEHDFLILIWIRNSYFQIMRIIFLSLRRRTLKNVFPVLKNCMNRFGLIWGKRKFQN